ISTCYTLRTRLSAIDHLNQVHKPHKHASIYSSTPIHDQPTRRQEEGGPARIGGGRYQNLTRGQMRACWVENDPRLRSDPSRRCWRSPQHALSLISLVSGECAGFGAI